MDRVVVSELDRVASAGFAWDALDLFDHVRYELDQRGTLDVLELTVDVTDRTLVEGARVEQTLQVELLVPPQAGLLTDHLQVRMLAVVPSLLAGSCMCTTPVPSHELLLLTTWVWGSLSGSEPSRGYFQSRK
jgi:hypothetical protein